MREAWRLVTMAFIGAMLILLSAADAPPEGQATSQPRGKPQPQSNPPMKPARVSPGSGGPVVISTARYKQQRGQSEFLLPPGAGKYDSPDVDWRDVPPWRQAEFFGIRARGQFFIYVVDCSGSMIQEDRLARAKEELRLSVARLRDPQRFHVIFYNDRPIPMPGNVARSAGLAHRSQLLSWLRLIEPDGETDPKGALAEAIAMRPDAIFLLSDGEYPDATEEALARMNRRQTPIHCVDLSGGAAGAQLRKIATDSGGRYVARSWGAP